MKMKKHIAALVALLCLPVAAGADSYDTRIGKLEIKGSEYLK